MQASAGGRGKTVSSWLDCFTGQSLLTWIRLLQNARANVAAPARCAGASVVPGNLASGPADERSVRPGWLVQPVQQRVEHAAVGRGRLAVVQGLHQLRSGN